MAQKLTTPTTFWGQLNLSIVQLQCNWGGYPLLLVQGSDNRKADVLPKADIQLSCKLVNYELHARLSTQKM